MGQGVRGLRLPKIRGFPLTLNVALTTVLRTNVLHCDNVIVISLDFSKAFDTVRQSTMLHKLDQLDIPDHACLLITLVDIRTVPSTAASSRRTSPSMPALYKALRLALRHT